MNTEQDKRTLRLAKRTMNKSSNSSSSSSSSSGNNKKKRKKSRTVNNNNNNNNNNEHDTVVVTVSVGLPLTTMVTYLAPHDILNCIQTCKEWQKTIDQEGVWREVAKVVSPNGVDAMTQHKEEKNKNKQNDSLRPEFNFRNMAIAFFRKSSEYNPPVGVDEYPQPTLQLADVLIVTEFRYNNKRVGALCRDLTESIKFDRSNDFIKGQLSSIILEDDWDARDNAFQVTTRLVRRDTGKSFCIHDYQPIDGWSGNGEYTEESIIFEDEPCLAPDAPNLSGIIARGLCHQYDYNSVRFHLEIMIDVIDGSEDQIRYCELSFDVFGKEDMYNHIGFNSMNHFLLFLEGLDWK